ncbi:hypothetical protein F511_26415 [Dorcoceras hygrometricum]|uniref:Uncharacterized protein n=1 Tax=Dorcoceras hygrometricum TaxID=472368 RepID=A0A2Z7CHA6_9LAMI|nr:hypothetical protein F511_26415 [Dorcoceras hygrometricum]
METLVVSHQRNQHRDYGRNRSHSGSNFGPFGSPPSSGLRGVSCRTFHSETGTRPTPLKSVSMIPVINRAFSASFSPRTPPSSVYKQKNPQSNSRSSSIPIPIKIEFGNEERSFGDQLHFSERWAGPAYSNSPPPSSLPIPKFSLRPKRTVSLDLPSSASKIDLRPIAKSAPASPTRERSPFPSDLCEPSDSATSTLRRMLNLDISDE